VHINTDQSQRTVFITARVCQLNAPTRSCPYRLYLTIASLSSLLVATPVYRLRWISQSWKYEATLWPSLATDPVEVEKKHLQSRV